VPAPLVVELELLVELELVVPPPTPPVPALVVARLPPVPVSEAASEPPVPEVLVHAAIAAVVRQEIASQVTLFIRRSLFPRMLGGRLAPLKALSGQSSTTTG